MKFMLQVLLLIAIGTYLHDQFRSFMLEKLAKLPTAAPRELRNYVPTFGESRLRDESVAPTEKCISRYKGKG
jgi:hypothetical protein